MIHRVAGRKLGRDTNQRKALFRSLANQLILHEKIVTTEAKARAVRPLVEKLVTRAKTNSIHARRMLLKELVSENTVNKMLDLIGPKFKERPGGYTRLVKMGSRAGDRAALVSLMFVEAPSTVVELPKKTAKTRAAKEVKDETAVAEEAPKEEAEEAKEIKKVRASKKASNGKNSK